MAFIRFGDIDAKLIPMIYGCIFCFLNRLLFAYVPNLVTKNPIINALNSSSSKLVTIIPFIMIKIRTKKINSNEIQDINKTISLSHYKKEQKKIIKGKWGFIVLSALIFLINQLFHSFALKAKSNVTIFNIATTSIFYYFIFNIKLYKHHYISIIVIVLIGLFIDLFLGNFQYDIKNNILLLIFRILREISFSLSCVIDKYIMEKKFGSVYEIICVNGIITTTLLMIFAIFDYNFIGLDDFDEYFDKLDKKEVLVFIGGMITQLGLNLGILFTNRNYTPCHVFIIFIFGRLAIYLNFSGKSIIIIICLLFMIFMSLIFDEIIEINICGLSDNTKKNIRLRAKDDEDLNRIDTSNSILLEGDQYILKGKDCKFIEFDEEEKNEE